MQHCALIAATLFWVTACTTSVRTANVAIPTPVEAPLATIERLLAAEFAKDSRGGLTAGIVQHGELTWTHSWGMADEAARRPMQTDSVFPIASATKIVTGIMLLQLVERGRVHLADPAERFVPEIRAMENPFPWAPPITLMQLATMTAGLERGLVGGDAAAMHAAKTWEDKMAVAVPAIKVAYEPGTVNRYLLLASDGNLDYGDGVGFASVRNSASKLTALGHGGSFTEGFLASYEFDGATGNGVILLANTTAGQAKYKPLTRKILEILAPDSSGGSGLPPIEEH